MYIILCYYFSCEFFQGGIRAVVWTDAFQMVVIMAGLLALLIRGTILVGGWERVMNLVYEGKRVTSPM